MPCHFLLLLTSLCLHRGSEACAFFNRHYPTGYKQNCTLKSQLGLVNLYFFQISFILRYLVFPLYFLHKFNFCIRCRTLFLRAYPEANFSGFFENCFNFLISNQTFKTLIVSKQSSTKNNDRTNF